MNLGRRMLPGIQGFDLCCWMASPFYKHVAECRLGQPHSGKVAEATFSTSAAGLPSDSGWSLLSGCDRQYARGVCAAVGSSRNGFARATAQQRDSTQHSQHSISALSNFEHCGCHHADQFDVLFFAAGAIVLCCVWDAAMPGSIK